MEGITSAEASWLRHAPRLLRWSPASERQASLVAYLARLGGLPAQEARRILDRAGGVGVYLDRLAADEVAWLVRHGGEHAAHLVQAPAAAQGECEAVLLAPSWASLHTLVEETVSVQGPSPSPALALQRLLTLAGREAFTLRTQPAITLRRSEPAIMGIVNVTPDSFSDGGQHPEPAAAIEHALQLVEHGAQILDVGGESTRPGAPPVEEEEEAARILPVIAALAKQLGERVPISVDTMKPAVARQALEAGASLVNDVSGFRDPEMVALLAQYQVPVCCMHMQGEPRTMQQAPSYPRDVLTEVDAFLRERTAVLGREAGLAPEQVVLDPGFGFGKTHAHNFTLLERLDELATLGQPVLAGLSRKSSLAAVSDQAGPLERIPETLAAHLLAAERGAALVRVHDVREMRKALAIWRATRNRA